MTTLRNFTTPIICAAAALTLSFMSISNTVSTPAAAPSATAVAAAAGSADLA